MFGRFLWLQRECAIRQSVLDFQPDSKVGLYLRIIETPPAQLLTISRPTTIVPLENLEISEPMRITLSWIILL